MIIHLVALRTRQTQDRLTKLQQVAGAYALVSVVDDKLMGVRDPIGIRPLILGQLGDAYILASETCALDIIGAKFIRDIEPAEMIVISKTGGKPQNYHRKPSRFCILNIFTLPVPTHP